MIYVVNKKAFSLPGIIHYKISKLHHIYKYLLEVFITIKKNMKNKK